MAKINKTKALEYLRDKITFYINQGNEKRIVKILKKLLKIKIDIQCLERTLIGKTVYKLRKLNGEIKYYADILIVNWKEIARADFELENFINTTVRIRV